ncbi:hypothetical protein BZG25_10120 [Salinivibrio sp. ML198]|nr:hypothetical protein BZG20_15285 [Salinivibrio sp. IB868]OOE74422.1 hypothetical protein BZG22_07950 [Salinivibrio sp. IB870]OOE79247.1 hypothetical protein BZG25_10120 [Salinivibrio sp. ML198]
MCLSQQDQKMNGLYLPVTGRLILLEKRSGDNMGCCNQSPEGGAKGLKPLLKAVGVLFVLIMALAYWIG